MQALIGVPSEPASGFELDAVQALYRLGVNMLHSGYEGTT
jgi:glutaredoxin-related protein